jgi:hypothetical protein
MRHEWKFDLVRLEIVLIMMQDRCTVWTHSMDLLGDVGHVKSRFGPFGNSVSGGAR